MGKRMLFVFRAGHLPPLPAQIAKFGYVLVTLVSFSLMEIFSAVRQGL